MEVRGSVGSRTFLVGETFVTNLFTQMGLDPVIAGKTIGSVVVVLIVILARWAALRTIHRTQEPEFSYRADKGLAYSAVILIGISLAWIWVDAFSNLATYIGIVSAGIAISLSDLLKNIVGWAFILIRRPFKIGDRIEVGGLKGDVVDVRLFRFTLLEVGGHMVDADQSTGRLLHVPNGVVFTQSIANYTEGFEYVWHELAVLVTFESDWRLARAIVEKAVKEHGIGSLETSAAELRKTARKYNIKVGSLSPIVYMTVKDSGVQLTGRFLVDPRKRRGADEAAWTVILDGFAAEPGVDLAYPTYRNIVDISDTGKNVSDKGGS